MATNNQASRKKLVDRLADAATPATDDSDVSRRPILWWLFFMPGKVILWIQYMFPERIVGVFGSSRRRNVPLIQLLYTIQFYIAVAVVIALFILAMQK
jgi:hypothetical protein